MKNIHHFTILGERCSGTHFLQHAILKNFHISYIKGEKHFFGNKNFRDSLDNPIDQWSLHEKQMKEVDAIPLQNLLVFCIVRDPVEWVDSFFKRKHHVPKENRDPIERFLSCEFYSVYEEGPKKNSEIMEDRNWKTKERYSSIFELRNAKCAYLLDHINSPHVCFVKYEDLRDAYDITLSKIQSMFDLRRKTSEFIKIDKYKGTFNALYEKKPVLLTNTICEYIWKNVDIEQEKRMGYICPY